MDDKQNDDMGYPDIPDDFSYEKEDIITDKASKIQIVKFECYLDKAIFSEVVDINCLNELIKSELLERAFDDNNYSQKFSATLYKNVICQLEEYFNKTYDKKTNIFNVMYAKPRSKWGRVFPNRSLGLTSFGKKIRNTLIKGKYVDLDLSNAHPMILYNICKKNDIPCPIITEYINDRENILTDVMKYYKIDRDIAKKLFLRLTFFGTHSGFLKELKINTNTKPLTFITNFINELKHIADLFKDENKQLYDTARRQNKTNAIGSFFSMYLQEYETRIMSCVIQWLNDKTDVTTYKNCKNKVLTYEFDGVKLLKENVDKYGIEKLKKDMEKVIFDELGFSMVFEEKPIEKCYDIEYEPFEHQEIKQVIDKQTLLEQQEYFYDDYQQFIGLVLSKNNEPTKDGDLFKKYYKLVFARVDCGGKTKYFSKCKKDGFINWSLLPSTPFGEKLSVFNYLDKIETSKGIVDKKYPITTFIGNLNKEYMTIYSDIDFIPYLYNDDIDINIFNLFSGFRFSGLIEDVDPEYYNDIKPILSHLKEVLCSDNEEIYNYVLKWIAHIVQKPCDKAGVPVILMKSEQGSGKNLFWDFMGLVIGKKYIVTINDLDDLTNKFNSRTEGKLLTILNEIANYGGFFKGNDKLKSLLTDIKQNIEPKGREAYEINNYSRSVMLTNNEWAAKISNDDRRYVPMDVSDHKKDDIEYFTKIVNSMNDKNAELFFHFLSQIDLTHFNVRTIPVTKLKEKMKWLNLENRPLYFLKEYIVDLNESEEPITKFTSKDLFDEYILWCSNNNERQTFSQRTFTQQIIKYSFNYIQFKNDGNNQRGFNITKQELKICIEKTLKIENYNFDN
jgi:hypothetical protein